MDLDIADLRLKLIQLIIVVSSLALHEWGHAYTADRLGDDTPRRMGRVTLNPLVHLDLIGSVLIPLLGMFTHFGIIGWAKPVWTNPRALRTTTNRALVTLAGPGVNLMLALVAALVGGTIYTYSYELAKVCLMVLTLNVGLAVFNLLPIPPLDGSKFLMYWFGMSEETYVNLSRYSWMFLLLLINVPATNTALFKLIALVQTPFIYIFNH